jgi:uncharacterized protein (TIRG00374 family)
VTREREKGKGKRENGSLSLLPLPFSLSRAARYVVAVLLTAYVIWKADPTSVWRATAGAHLWWIGVAVALVLVDRTLMAMRWLDLLAALTPGSRPPFAVVLRIFFVSTFMTNFMPSVAADVYRAYALARHDVHLAESAASVLMDRVLGVLSMVLLGAAALIPASSVRLDAGIALGLAVTAVACAIMAVVVFSERAAAALQRAVQVVPSTRVQRIAVELTDAVRRYSQHHAELFRVLVMSIAVQAIRIVQAWCIGCALGIDLSLGAYFVLIPVILVILQLPITINGFGTGQLAFERLLVPAGAAAPQAVALSILFIALGFVGNLPGGILYIFSPATPVERSSTS